MKMTLIFESTTITVEKLDTVWFLKDNMVGSVHGTLEYCLNELEAHRKRLVKNQLQLLLDRVYTTDLSHVTKPVVWTDSDGIQFAWVVPQGTRWVVIPLCLPCWMSTPMCGASAAAITKMWWQWLEDPIPSPDLKQAKELLGKL